MALPNDTRPFVWLLTGGEGYGVLSTVNNLASGLRERGLATCIAALQDGPACVSLEASGHRVVRLDTPVPQDFKGGIPQRIKSVLRNWRDHGEHVCRLSNALSPLEPRVVHWLGPHLTTLAAPAARAIGAIPVWEVPNLIGAADPTGLGRRLYQNACRRWRVEVLPNSEFTEKSIAANGIRSTVNYACVDDTRFDPESIEAVDRAQLGIPEDRTVVAVVARLDPSKGQLELLQALRKIVDEDRTPLSLLLVGGPTDSAYADRVRQVAEGSPGLLTMTGPAPRPEVYYPLVDIAVNSRVDPEPFGMSVIEAMLMRKPVLAHALGGPSETIIDGVCGWLAHDATPEGFAAAMRRALGERPRWEAMGQAGRERALEHFSRRVIIDRYLQTVQQAEAAPWPPR